LFKKKSCPKAILDFVNNFDLGEISVEFRRSDDF
jgi:hypothetical protein